MQIFLLANLGCLPNAQNCNFTGKRKKKPGLCVPGFFARL
jgi:hypothetical protein